MPWQSLWQRESLSTETGSSLSPDGHFARNVKWQFVANGAQALLAGAYIVALGRLLGASEFGVFSIVSALISVAGLLLELRIQDVVARDFCYAGVCAATNGDGAKIVDLFALEIVSRLLPAFGLIVLAPLLSASSRLPPAADSYIVVAALGYLVAKSGWGVSTGALRVLGRTDLIAMCLAADWGLRLCVTLCCAALWGISVMKALLIAFIVGGSCNLAQVIIAAREFSRRVAPIRFAGWNISAALTRLRASRRLIVSNFGVSASDLMTRDLDIAMISSILPVDKVGLYKLAKSFAQMIWRGIDPFYLAIMPEVRRLWVIEDKLALKTLLRSTSVRLLALSAALICAAYVVVAEFGGLVLGAEYPGLPTLMLTMSLWIIVCAPLVWAHPLAVAINRPELAVIGGILGTAVGLAAFWMLTPTLGIWGATIAWSSTTIITFSFIAVSSVRFSKLLYL